MMKKLPFSSRFFKNSTLNLLLLIVFSVKSFGQLTPESVTYLEDFNSRGIPTNLPNNGYWTFHNEIHPSQDTWEKFIPGDGYAYLTVDADISNDLDWIHPFQTLEFGRVAENHRLEVRMKGAVVDGGLVGFLFTYEQEGSIFNEVDIEIVANDSATPSHETLPANGGWTDARFNTWRNANENTGRPFTGTKKPVVDGANQKISLIDDQFHTYTIDWREDRIDFFIDDVLQETITTNVATKKSEVILGFRQLPWAGDFNWSGTHTMVVDYLKIEPIEVITFAANDFIDTQYNTTTVLDVLNNDTANSNIVAFDPITAEGNTITAIGNQLAFTPLNNFVGQDSFNYTIEDEDGEQVSATVFITAKPRPLDAVDDAISISVGSTNFPIDVLANDAFGEFGENPTHPLTLAGGKTSTASNNGAPINVVDNKINYTVPNGFTGVDTFIYTITDGIGYAKTATVTVTVEGNLPRIVNAVNDTYTIDEDTATTFDVLSNDTAGTSIVSYDGVSIQGGSVSATASTITYTPASGFIGVDTFTYTIEDGAGTQATATVTVNVEEDVEIITDPLALNATDDTFTVSAGVSTLIDVTENDSYGTYGPHAGHPLTLVNGKLITASTNTALIAVENGKVNYTPPAGFTGVDTFTYTITDARGFAATATVTITVGGGVTTEVIAANDTYTIDEDITATFDVLSNDTSGTTIVSYDAISVQGGTVSATASTVTYTPASGFIGVDTFTYTIEDGAGTQATATVTITVEELVVAVVNAVNDTYTIDEDTTTTFNVLSNDTAGATIDSYDAVSVQGGSVSATASTITYTPASGFIGVDTFTYTIEDGAGTQATATVTVNVEAEIIIETGVLNATDDTFTVSAGVSTLIDVTENDSYGTYGPHAGHPLTLVNGKLITASTNTALIAVENGKVNYTPPAGFTGVDTFTYTITDASGFAATATVIITVGEAISLEPSVSENEFSVAPNPSTGYVRVVLTSNINTQAALLLFDLTGSVVYSTTFHVQNGTNEFEFNINVQPGIKVMSISSSTVDFGSQKILFE